MLVNRIFRVKYFNDEDYDKDNVGNNPYKTKNFKVFTKALAFAKLNCEPANVAGIDEIKIHLIGQKETEEIGTQWSVTPECHVEV